MDGHDPRCEFTSRGDVPSRAERHTVATAWFEGWSGLKNGALLDAAEEAGFELFITADQG
jgi:hypothetical protein